ncbi:oxidoreductase [Ilyonectria sp. MPI-CAGE-AT-0026]|nr:oxidoreductase [Ilyonectria sp. MPI-CAGE-AT-0026]
MVTRLEVSRHKTRDSCWVIIKDCAYDVTEFMDLHPGGHHIILKHAGRDATDAFESFHSEDILHKHIGSKQTIGRVIGAMAPPAIPKDEPGAVKQKGPQLFSILNIVDFEEAASQVLPPKAFAFFKSGADDEKTTAWNQISWQAIRFRPRVLQPIEAVDTSTQLLGTTFSAPFFISPAGGGKLANPTGEVLMTKAAANEGVLQWVCNNAGCSQKQMADARGQNQTLYWQIYAMRDLSITEREIRQAIAAGYKGFALTVDAIQVGKRERDMRLNIAESVPSGNDDEDRDLGLSGGIAVTRPHVYSKFDWVSAVKWLREITDLPIAIKGIQCWEDAALCMEHGVHPWLSNHGGRQLEGAPAALETLLEIRQHCPEVLDKCEVMVDGGITRGTDIVKALALGAKGVGLGRAFLYALAFGEPGVRRAIRILKQEVETAMALLGVSSIDQLNPSYVSL